MATTIEDVDPDFEFIDREGDRRRGLKNYLELRSDEEYRVVKITDTDDVRVVTVWFGVDQGFGDEGGPLIFGSAVAGIDESEIFAATESDAVENHEHLVLKYSC